MRNRCVLTRVYFSTPNRLERFRYNFDTYTNKLVLASAVFFLYIMQLILQVSRIHIDYDDKRW